MRRIPLSQGKFALVDDEDFETLSQWKWHWDGRYAVRNLQRIKGRRPAPVLMHRVINNTPEGFFTDHIDRNKLNNQRTNLHTVTPSQNNYNQDLTKGIGFHKASKKWRAHIQIKGKQIHLGLFLTEEQAFEARHKALKSATLT